MIVTIGSYLIVFAVGLLVGVGVSELRKLLREPDDERWRF